MDAPLLDLRAGRLNLACTAGDDVQFYLPTPSDLTTWDWSGQVRAQPDPDSPLLGEWDIDVAADQALCQLLNAVTTAIGDRTVVYDIKVVKAGIQRTLLAGFLEVSPAVSS